MNLTPLTRVVQPGHCKTQLTILLHHSNSNIAFAFDNVLDGELLFEERFFVLALLYCIFGCENTVVFF